MFKIVCLLFSLLIAGPSFADVEVGQTYIVTETLNLRSSPPKSFYRLGDIVGEVESGTKVVIKEVLERSTLIGTSYWYKVSPEENKNLEAWVFSKEKWTIPEKDECLDLSLLIRHGNNYKRISYF